jgi:hypothetical protein
LGGGVLKELQEKSKKSKTNGQSSGLTGIQPKKLQEKLPKRGE